LAKSSSKSPSCGICGTDLKKIHTGSHSAPRIFGHETAGTIVATGAGVQNFSIGERVMVFHHVPCGNCYYCRKKTYAQCPVYKPVGVTAGFEPSGGGFAEYVRVMDWIVRDGGVVRIPGRHSLRAGSFRRAGQHRSQGHQDRSTWSRTRPCWSSARAPSASCTRRSPRAPGLPCLTSDLYPERHAIAAKFGLHHPIHAATEDVAARAREATEGRGADAVILAVGHNALIRTAMEAVRPGGKVLLFAQTQHGESIFDPGAVCMDEKFLLGSYSSSIDIQDEVDHLVFRRL
jgi:L-iditol 2-dehydrogenase